MVLFHWRDLKVKGGLGWIFSDVVQYPTAQTKSIPLSPAAASLMSAEPLFPLEEDDSSDDDNVAYLVGAGIWPGLQEPRNTNTLSGGQHRKRPNLRREFEGAVDRLMTDYFGISPRFTNRDFERRFRIRRSVYEMIFSGVNGNGIFVRRFDVTNKAVFILLPRVVAALCMLAYGVAAGALDENIQMSVD